MNTGKREMERKSKRKKAILSGKCAKEKKKRKSKRLGRSWGNLLEGARRGSLGPNRP